jgi:hypothetical protein
MVTSPRRRLQHERVPCWSRAASREETPRRDRLSHEGVDQPVPAGGRDVVVPAETLRQLSRTAGRGDGLASERSPPRFLLGLAGPLDEVPGLLKLRDDGHHVLAGARRVEGAADGIETLQRLMPADARVAGVTGTGVSVVTIGRTVDARGRAGGAVEPGVLAAACVAGVLVSCVQGSPSSQSAAPSTHADVQGATSTRVCWQLPATQESAVQESWSSQSSACETHPRTASQCSTVQGFLSSHGVPLHFPPVQTSPCVHALPSLHDVPAGGPANSVTQVRGLSQHARPVRYRSQPLQRAHTSPPSQMS